MAEEESTDVAVPTEPAEGVEATGGTEEAPAEVEAGDPAAGEEEEGTEQDEGGTAPAAVTTEEDGWKLDPAYFLAEDDPRLASVVEEGALPKQVTKAGRFLGFDFKRLYNLTWLSETEYAYITGHVVIIVNTETGSQRTLTGRDNGGIGGIALSLCQKYLAVGEKSTTRPPNVYIYEYNAGRSPSLYRLLEKGTDNGYACVAFSPHGKGDHIAALGCAPDYLLSVWDWRNERLLLKCKAYGQDVFGVRWGQFAGQLITSGTGHLRFWKMALTFTGLKLQGAIGKFGATELSDIVGLAEMPDGKVVTGTEYGRLLLWEGVFVKVELMRGSDDDPRRIAGLPHKGNIDVIMVDKEENCVVSGGEDGYLRWWPMAEIDEAEADYDLGILEYGISMLKEVRIPPEHTLAHIVHVARSFNDRIWLIQDVRNGVIWRYDRNSGECLESVQSHAGPITGVMVFPSYTGLTVSSGADGTLRVFNATSPGDAEIFCDRRDKAVTCIAQAPEAIDPERRTLCAGYADGVLRAFSFCRDGFVLIQAQKPHNCPVRLLEYSPDGCFLASVGVDNTIFFFEMKGIEDHMFPSGFVQVHCNVNHIVWHDSGRLLCSLEDGTIVELDRPVSDMMDRTDTYLVHLDFRSVLPEVPEPEELQEEDDEEEEGEEGETEEEREERRERRKREQEAEAAAAAAAKAAAEEEEDEDGGQKEVEKTTIVQTVYMPNNGSGREGDDVALFVGTGIYAGGLWTVPLDSAPMLSCEEAVMGEHPPTPVMATLLKKLPDNIAVTKLSISPTQRFLFIGFANGNVWAVPFMNMNVHAVLNVADAATGRVNSIDCDSVENLVVIGAGDGTLSTVTLHSDGLIEMAEMKAKNEDADLMAVWPRIEKDMPTLPSVEADSWDLPFVDSPGLVTMARDITNPNEYSIQDAKVKLEEDNAKTAAEQKKRRVHEKIADLRRELEDLKAKNANISCNQLTSTELTIDLEYIEHLHQDAEHQVKETRRELSFEVEFCERGMQKLRDYYLGRLDFERVEVLAFSSPHRVATFRCPAMSDELQTNLARLHELIFAADRHTDEEDEDGKGFGDTSGRAGGDRTGLASTAGGFGFGDITGMNMSGDSVDGNKQMTAAARAAAERRQQRLQRKQQMIELDKTRPSDSYEDPQDVEAIAHAQATMGNYMLKTSDSYQVPENQRMNAEKKRRQMFLLEESMHAIKTEFNHRVLALRDFRQQVRQEVKRDLAALAEIDEQLGTTTNWVHGILDDPPGAPPEFPERRFELTEGDLKAYEKQVKGEVETDKVAEVETHDDDEDPEDDDQGEDEEDVAENEDGGGQGRRVAKAQAQPVTGRSALAVRRIARLSLRTALLQTASSNVGKAVFDEARARLRHDKAQLEEHIRQVIDTFNSAVASIEKEKAKLESDLKNADMKLLVLFEELLTLNELEEKDEALLQKATRCRQEKTSIMHQIKECQDQLGEKKAEIEQWHNEEQTLQADFTDLVGENSPFLGKLLSIYKKKVKRSKRKKVGEEEDFDEDEDEDEDEEDMDSEEEDDDMEEEVGPPQGCDVQIFESVLDLREKRLDMEDALKEIQEAVEALKGTHKTLLDNERKIDKEQKQTDNEIQQFQTDKQRKLNQVEIVFALRLSQVQCLGEISEDTLMLGVGGVGSGRLPQELDGEVVFTHEGLLRLMHRITELHQEIKEVKVNFRQLQKDFRARKREKNQVEQNIEDLQAKFRDIQMLKFGQIVDLDLIERNAPNKHVQDLQERVFEAEREQRRRLAEWEKRIEKQRKDLTKVTSENTQLMDQIVSMGYSQMQLDAALNARIASVTVNDTEPLVELRELERERLKDLLTLQSKEVATLQAEINLFRRKGGHIYTTVTANRT